MTSTELTLAVRGRQRRVIARAVGQGDVKQADAMSTTCNSTLVVIRPTDVQKTADRFMEVERRRQFVPVIAQRRHHLDVTASERRWNCYERQRKVLLVPTHPCVAARFAVARPVVGEQHHDGVPQTSRVAQRAEEAFQKGVHVRQFVHVFVQQTGEKAERKDRSSVGSRRRISGDGLHHVPYLHDTTQTDK